MDSIKILMKKSLFGITTYIQCSSVQDFWKHYGHECKLTNAAYVLFISVTTIILLFRKLKHKRMKHLALVDQQQNLNSSVCSISKRNKIFFWSNIVHYLKVYLLQYHFYLKYQWLLRSMQALLQSASLTR